MAFEDVDGLFDELGCLFQDFSDRLAAKALNISDRYREGKLYLVVEAERDSENFRIICKGADCLRSGRHRDLDVNNPIWAGSGDRSRLNEPFEINVRLGGGYRDQSLVLIQVVEEIQKVEMGTTKFTPAPL
ncbi:hypothetical protein [Bradyrhizobium sp. OAE829]|uniref:hypothetical protein n=1 Tax=Bradyrhizobium sp. OAE829 TaxID=2663807 RepID=UPI00178B6E22